MISGKVNDAVELEEADQAIQEVIDEFCKEGIQEQELQKVKNQAEATLIYSETEVLNRSIQLAYHTLMGDTNGVNLEADKIQAVTSDEVQAAGKEILRKENSSTLYYRGR